MKKNDKDKAVKAGTLSATLVLILIALLLVFVGYIYLSIKNGYTLDDLIDNIVGNLIGVLGAFLLFDIIYNKLTQDEYAQEVSQQITKTLMGDPATLDVFDDKDKRNFLVSTIQSMMDDEDSVDMIVGNMDKYFQFTDSSRIRKNFNYVITLSTEFPAAYDDFPGVKNNEYYYVQENLAFKVKFLSDKYYNYDSTDIRIGFSFDKLSLDGGLMETGEDAEFSKCVFNESLEVTSEAVKYLKGLSKDELQPRIEEMFTPVLKIDDQNGELKKVDMRRDGFVLTYKVGHDVTSCEHSVRVIFHMPKLWNSVFEVTLVDPTKNPKITFDYMPDKMDVRMYSYLNKETASNDGAYEMQNGLFDISINEEWIYPKSGIVFFVKEKK